MLTLSVPKGGVTELAYLPDGRTLLTGDAAGRVFAWDLPSQRPELLLEIRGAALDKAIQTLGCSADGRWIAAASWNGFRIWDRVNATARALVSPGVRARWPAALTPDGRGLLACGYAPGSRVYYWDLLGKEGPKLWSDGYAESLALSADGRTAATTRYLYGSPSHRWLIQIWDLPSGRVVTELSDDIETSLVAFSPNGSWLAAAGSTSVRLRDTATWQRRVKITHGRAQGRVYVRRVAFHPSGSLLATAGDAPFVTFWDTATGKERARFDWGMGRVLSLAFSPDGLTCAAGGSNRKFIVWDVEL
jgi:WD40 repeat protein